MILLTAMSCQIGRNPASLDERASAVGADVVDVEGIDSIVAGACNVVRSDGIGEVDDECVVAVAVVSTVVVFAFFGSSSEPRWHSVCRLLLLRPDGDDDDDDDDNECRTPMSVIRKMNHKKTSLWGIASQCKLYLCVLDDVLYLM